MKYRMKLVQTIEKIFEFDCPINMDAKQRHVAAWKALDEDNVKFLESFKRERLEPSDI